MHSGVNLGKPGSPSYFYGLCFFEIFLADSLQEVSVVTRFFSIGGFLHWAIFVRLMHSVCRKRKQGTGAVKHFPEFLFLFIAYQIWAYLFRAMPKKEVPRTYA